MKQRKSTLVFTSIMAMISAGCLALLTAQCTFLEPGSGQSALEGPVFGMKVNQSHWLTSEDQQQRLIDFCIEYGIGKLIISIRVVQDPQHKNQSVVEHSQQLTAFITRAAKNGITIEGLDRVAHHTDAENRTKVLAKLQTIIAFNKTLPSQTRLVGLHYEIDFSDRSKLKTSDHIAWMHQSLDLFASMRWLLDQKNSKLRLSAGLPGSYESLLPDKDHPTMEFEGQHKKYHEHLQEVTDYVAISCSRRPVESNLAISNQAETALGYAQWADRSVYLMMETSRLRLDPDSSYFGRPTKEFWIQKREAEQALHRRQEFGGVYVNNYESLKQMLSEQSAGEMSSPTNNVFGMWVWHEKWIRVEKNHDRILDFCQTWGINLMLIQIHADRASVKRGKPILRHANQLRSLIEKARRRGIRVEALDGAPEMALAKNRGDVLAILDLVLAFNRTLPPHAALSGMHFDIEPYLLPGWNTPQRQQIMRQFLELMEAADLKIKLDGLHMTLSASIPFWYDEKVEPGDTCVLEYNGQKKNFHEHIQDITDYVAIMSYRRTSLGKDSITEKLEAERSYAEWIGRYVCAGLETLEIKDHPEVSFYGVKPSEFWFQKQKLEYVMERHGGFGGIVVHSYESFAPYLSNKSQ